MDFYSSIQVRYLTVTQLVVVRQILNAQSDNENSSG